MLKVIKMLKERSLKDGTTKKLPSYYLCGENGNRIMIRPVYDNDWRVLDYLSEFVSEEE